MEDGQNYNEGKQNGYTFLNSTVSYETEKIEYCFNASHKAGDYKRIRGRSSLVYII